MKRVTAVPIGWSRINSWSLSENVKGLMGNPIGSYLLPEDREADRELGKSVSNRDNTLSASSKSAVKGGGGRSLSLA
jgi:hypothetical protein